MKIRLKLFASLGDFLPREREGNEAIIDAPEGATVAQVLDPLAMPPGMVHLVLVNGVYVAPGARSTKVLAEGDALAVWPPVAGG